MNIADLKKPFPVDAVEWRVGNTSGDKTKGLALAYHTARHVMDRLDEVCNPECWQDKYEVQGSRIICTISICINGEWVSKSDGAGDTQVEAEKGGMSDAFKRAAVKWGVGRYLYQLENIWVQLQPAGRSYKIANSEHGRLQGILSQHNEGKSFSGLMVSDEDNKEADEVIELLQNATDANSLIDLWGTERVKAAAKGPRCVEIVAAKEERKQQLGM